MKNPDRTHRHMISHRRWTLFVLIALAVVACAIPVIRPADSADPLVGSLIAAAATPTPIPPAPADTGPKIGFENFEGPGALTQVTTSSQGQPVNTVEYIAHDAGEPSIGVNWNSPNSATGVTVFQSDLQTLFVTFDDSCSLTGPKATWVNRPAPTSVGVDQDPIGFTDRQTGRTFAAQLTLTSPTCKTSYTDDDGHTWVPTAGFGIGSGIDHQTIGGGPYHAPVPPLPTPYQHAFYYCSQLPAAACARSDDGGLTFGPVVEIDPVADAHCLGIHGHVKVGPDGTVYVPTNGCDGIGSVIVSEDNGLTWTIRHVQNNQNTTTTNPNIIDAQVGIDDSGKVYFAMANGDGKAVVATSNDHGVTWQNIYDVGAAYGVQTSTYPYVVAADAGRAAVAFLGTKAAGDGSANSFNGVWHLFVATTFDGGAHWTTSDVTPNDPIQRGCIWAHGGADICRNLLDFIGLTVDKQGRIEVGYVDGCPGGNCAQAPVAADGTSGVKGNAYAALGVIARQSSGRRLVAAFDPPDPLTATSAPGMPSVTTRRVGSVVHLGWSEADTGNSPILNYQILRGTTSGGETLLATTADGTQTTYDDTTATDTTKTYYYKVVAVNAVGASCANNEVAAPYVGDTCTGLILQRTPPGHPEQTTQGQTPASLAIDYIAVGEPAGTNNFMFKMKTDSLASVPPNSRWRIVWNSYAATGQQFYVGMRTDQNSAATFDYGHIATAVVGLVVGVPTETKDGNALAQSNFNPDGTITIYVPKSAFGNPQPGDLLGAVNGRTFTGDTPETNTLERSNALMDHTFVKGQRDNGAPAATYTVAGACQAAPKPPPYDFDGDGKSDISTFRGPEGLWSAIPSSNQNGPLIQQFWGSSNLGDIIIPADYDGDGKADFAVFRPSEGRWYIHQNAGGDVSIPWGLAGDIPVPADYDGDGKADLAVFRPSDGYWYILKSTDGQFLAVPWGISTDKPVVGDYNGDGKADFAIARVNDPSPGQVRWYIAYNGGGGTFVATQWGAPTDIIVGGGGDFDGDRKADLTVFRPSDGVWYILKSSGGFSNPQWGLAADIPVAGDYDGDHRTDVAIYRPSEGTWYVLGSTSGFSATPFGNSTDTPVPSAFNR